jgi:phosphohistidine phosphatase
MNSIIDQELPMSKTLYLMRHSKAEHTSGMRDIDRALTDEGMRDSRRQAEQIFKDRLPDRFVASTAVRTMQTAQYMQEALRFDEELIQYDESLYLASSREMLNVITHLDDLWKSVCIVGHNPTISYIAEYLCGEEIGDITTSGIVKINFDGSWVNLSQRSAYFEFYQPR